MARHLHRELRELTDIQVAELWLEVNAEHESRLGAHAERRPEARPSQAGPESAPAEAEEEPAPGERRVFFQCQVWSSRYGRCWHSLRDCHHIARSREVTETTVSGYIEPEDVFLSSWFTDRRKEPCGSCTPCIRGMVYNQHPRLLEDPRLLAAKLREETEEVVEATDREHLAWECADLLYHLLVRMGGAGIGLERVESELRSRSR